MQPHTQKSLTCWTRTAKIFDLLMQQLGTYSVKSYDQGCGVGGKYSTPTPESDFPKLRVSGISDSDSFT